MVTAVYAHCKGLKAVQALFYGIAPQSWRSSPSPPANWSVSPTAGTGGLGPSAWWSSPSPPSPEGNRSPQRRRRPADVAPDARRRVHLPRRRTPDLAKGTSTQGFAAWPLASTDLGTMAFGGTLVSIRLFFLKTGALVFGSGLAIVPLLPDGVVAQHHRLTQAQFLDAVAMGLITPGRSSSPPPHRLPPRRLHRRTHRHRRRLYPIYLGVVVRGRWFIRHRDNPRLKAFGTGATAAIALLALLWRFKLPSRTSSAPPKPWVCCCTDWPHEPSS